MAAPRMVTPAMREHAAVLLSRSATWARGTAQLPTGGRVAFVMFSSSRTDKAGQPIYHRTARDGHFCSCPGYAYRSICCHVVAVKADAEAAVRPPAVRYEDRFGLAEVF